MLVASQILAPCAQHKGLRLPGKPIENIWFVWVHNSFLSNQVFQKRSGVIINRTYAVEQKKTENIAGPEDDANQTQK